MWNDDIFFIFFYLQFAYNRESWNRPWQFRICIQRYVHIHTHTRRHITGFVRYRGGRHLVGKAGPQGRGDALRQVGIIEDDCGVFASQFQRKPFAVRSTFLRDPLGCQRASREGDQRHVRVADEGFSSLGACSKHDVHHPVGYSWWEERHPVIVPFPLLCQFHFTVFCLWS